MLQAAAFIILTNPKYKSNSVYSTLKILHYIKNGLYFPVGRYCEWTHKTIDQSAASETFEDYMKTVQLECNDGEPAVLNWTVAHETPDLVYYQVTAIFQLLLKNLVSGEF